MNALGGSSSISTVIDSGVRRPSSISVSEDAEDVRVIWCGAADGAGVYSNGKMLRISEAGILAFGKSEAMKRRSPIGVKVHTSSKRSRFVCERTAAKGSVGRKEPWLEMPTFDDDDLTVNDGDRKRTVFHHGLLSAEVLQEIYKRREVVGRENTLGKQNDLLKRGPGL